MRHVWLVLMLGLVVSLLSLPTGASAQDRVAQQLADGTWQKVADGPLPFRLYAEPGVLRSRRGVPVVVYLHGRGWDVMSNDRMMNIPKAFAQRENYRERPCIIIVPQAPTDGDWDRANLRKVLEILDAIEAHFSVDADRVYLTGYSMGAGGTYKLLALAPERFAAAAVAAGRPNRNLAEAIAHIPMRAFIGTEDDPPVVNNSRGIAQALKDLDADFILTEFEGEGHGIGGKVFRETPGLHAWLFAQRRPDEQDADE